MGIEARGETERMILSDRGGLWEQHSQVKSVPSRSRQTRETSVLAPCLSSSSWQKNVRREQRSVSTAGKQHKPVEKREREQRLMRERLTE